jgi:RNA polymerase sigma factor (sigma-70 family)
MTGTEQPDGEGSSDHGTLLGAVAVTRAAHPGDAALDRFLAERAGHLLRAAVLLTGSMQAGEDLVQAALEQVLPGWRAIDEDPGAQVRRAVYHLAAHGRRRAGRRRPSLGPLRRAGDRIASDDGAQVELVRLLLRLPPEQRAAIVLRYWEDLSEAEAAEVLGCSARTVRSAAAHGLRRLRRGYGPRLPL